jgi:hypothetical protein
MNETLKDPVNEKPMTGQDEPSTESNGPARLQAMQLTPEAMAKGLGWFSIALGVAELLAPKATAQATGVNFGKNLLQAYGVREIATGIGLLTSKDPQPWLWARVAGDALDLATLAADLASNNNKRRNTAMALIAVMGVTALDVWAADTARREARRNAEPPRDYSDRVGMALSPDEMRGKARDAMQSATDLQTPSALRPYTLH